MSFIRFRTKVEKSHVAINKLTELDVIAISSRADREGFLVSVLVSYEEDLEIAAEYLENNAVELIRFIKIIKGFDPYLELFIDYKPQPNDSQQSEKYNLAFLKLLAKSEIELVVTVALPIDE